MGDWLATDFDSRGVTTIKIFTNISKINLKVIIDIKVIH